ncbi:MAG: ShlB/FhaC/HecB family hemolysin secretion/activation protein [Jaaginema sp. PMC 1079.18]|nr:ShlB/FhaC/HecB family hemolysin secretion/activation protein [Jaaginema sp. PMC 1080.18]MEC4850415.1 ShlB/FhaC/HecB family hemolysin secretion/activation protein [Jaaginema sp. PMC 1079.18]MEC4864751.1 ShlB/FhaC/HecB family hemolysin secretion/activation protein [Jaaginema sp. PMC 1078.18]
MKFGFWVRLSAIASWGILTVQCLNFQPVVAQSQAPNIPDTDRPIEAPPLLEPPEDLLDRTNPALPDDTRDSPGDDLVFTINRYRIEGSTIFTEAELAEVIAPFLGEITYAEVLSARSAITQLYLDRGYLTTGAYVPQQILTDNTATIRVVEGKVSAIEVTGLQRLNPGYVSSRIALAAETPLNVPKLQEALQLLQLDPLIATIDADLAQGTQPGENILRLEVREESSFNIQVNLSNDRAASIGTFRRGINVAEGNLLGLGDRASLAYNNTDGSNVVDLSYRIPFNPRNGTLEFRYLNGLNRIVTEPFEELDIKSRSQYWEFNLRQPVVQTLKQEFSLRLIFSHQAVETSILGIPFPLSDSADINGRTQVSALRFVQEWVYRSPQDAIAFRSQFSWGLDWWDATINETTPDSRFWSWTGQFQYLRLLAPDTTIIFRSTAQKSDRPLIGLEQFNAGGLGTIRGYPQDFLSSDNALTATLEVRLPIFRNSQHLVQIAPFCDWGTFSNNGDNANPSPQSLASVGLGLAWQGGDHLFARLDWGIPLVDANINRDRTWQSQGVYFTVGLSF